MSGIIQILVGILFVSIFIYIVKYRDKLVEKYKNNYIVSGSIIGIKCIIISIIISTFIISISLDNLEILDFDKLISNSTIENKIKE